MSADANADRGESPEGDLARTQRDINEELIFAALRSEDVIAAGSAREAVLIAQGELRERLLGILGHDLRTPLGAIVMGASVMIGRGKLEEPDALLAARLLGSANRMGRMISQILDFTRARLGGGMRLDVQPADLPDLCRNVAAEVALTAPVGVICDLEGDLTASLDADRVTEALSNILRNAVEHATRGANVVLRGRREGGQLLIEISNEGPPIPPTLLPAIFEPFRRANDRQPSKSGNLGLGLYIAHEITRAHSGSLVAQCADGKTVFRMRLPCVPPAPQSEPGPPATTSVESSEESDP